MRNLKATAMVAGAIVGGLVLGGVGIATATTIGQATPGTTPAIYASAETTPPMTPPSGDATVVVTPPSDATTPVVTPGSGGATGSVTPTHTPRPAMPGQSRGHAYGRMMSHPNSGLHLGWNHVNSTKHMAKHATRHMSVTTISSKRNSTGNSGHMGGSMMGR